MQFPAFDFSAAAAAAAPAPLQAPPQDPRRQPIGNGTSDGEPDLSMELSRVMSAVDAEAEMHSRVVAFESQLRGRTAEEARAAVLTHEAALEQAAAADRESARLEVQNILAQARSHGEMVAAEARTITEAATTAFAGQARNELQQYEAYLMQQSAVDQHDAMAASVHKLEHYLGGIFAQRAEEMRSEYEEHHRSSFGILRNECHAELLRAEAHARTAYAEARAQAQLETEEVVTLRRSLEATAAASDRAVGIAAR